MLDTICYIFKKWDASLGPTGVVNTLNKTDGLLDFEQIANVLWKILKQESDGKNGDIACHNFICFS